MKLLVEKGAVRQTIRSRCISKLDSTRYPLMIIAELHVALASTVNIGKQVNFHSFVSASSPVLSPLLSTCTYVQCTFSFNLN